MSGIDEQILDFPSCLKCTDWNYWRGKRFGKSEVYFNPIEFFGGAFRVAVYDGEYTNDGRAATVKELNEVVLIECDECGARVFDEMMSDILAVAKRLIGDYKCQG